MDLETAAFGLGIIMEHHPELTAHGFGVDELSYSTEAEKQDVIARERAYLATCAEAFDVACDFFKEVRPRATINKKLWNSYVGKHWVEKFARTRDYGRVYIPEGAYIAAALWERFTAERIPGSVHVYLNISSKTKIDGIPLRDYR
jgi:hypothetical protein